MGNHHDSIALDWVRGEIQDTLTQGQHALEAYVENRDDTARLRFCLNYLHQVHGTLKMVELYGAALLTEEMENLTQAVLNDTVANTDEAVEVLMQAILQLPQYLEHLTSSQDDFPMVLLPLLNDLRAARGESLLSDTSLFKPNLAPSRITVTGKVSRRLQDPTVLGHTRKLRQMYQFALAGVIRESDLRTHFEYMQKVIQRLIRLCQKTPRGELWKAASAFVETLQTQVNPVNAAVKSLLRELDSEIRRLTEEHTDILQQPVPEALFKHLLYYVARARDLDSPQVSALQDAYQLNQALPSEGDVDAARTRVSGPGRDAIHSVVGALNEELTKLKDQLDLYVRSELRQNSELENLLPGLRQVANTLAVLGLGIPRKVITEQVQLVEKLSAKTEQVDDGTLMDIAGALLYVEASLAGLDREGQQESSAGETSDAPVNPGSRELGEASGALLRESRNTLEQVKSAIVNFIASQWDVREIEQVPGLLHSIRGGLSLIPLDRVADILTSAERYITEVLLNSKQTPDWKQLDILADAVTSIEYYLERLAEGIGENDSILKVAEDSLASLGFPVGAEPTWSASAEEKIPVVGPVDEPPETRVTAAREATRNSDTELLDDEILGIFIEEAEEVLETIHEFYPRLRQNHDDREALTEVRRAFHTLKGSGRLVGATSIGELAWSVENLLNHLIDQTIHATGDTFALMDEVNGRIPSLIREFKEGQTAGDVEALISRAEAMATTRRADDEAMAETGTPGLEGTTEDKNTAETVSGESTDDNDLIDDEILEIFVEEAGEVLDTIHGYLPMLLRQHDDRSALSEIRRAFHTLKGSGRMVGALVIGELAWSVENMLNRVIDGSIFMNSDIASLLEDVTANLPALVEDFEKHRAPSVDTSNLEARANALANGEIPDASMMPVAELDGSEAMAEAGTDAADAETTEEDAVDPVLLDIFESETETHLQTLKDFLSTAGDKTSVTYTDDLSRALHTLKGSAQTAGINPIAAVITPLERFVKESRARNKRASRDVLSLIESACDFLTQGLAQIRENPQISLPGTEAFLEKLDRLTDETLRSHSEEAPRQHPQQAPSQLVQLFLNEGLDIVLDADRILDHWAENPGEMASLNPLRSELEQLASGASDAGLGDVAALAGALKETYNEAAKYNEAPNQTFFETVRAAHEQLINMMDQVAAGLATESSDDVVTALKRLKQAQAPEHQEPDAFEQEFTGDLEEIDLSFEMDETETPASAEPATTEQPPLPETAESDDEMDEELAEIFLEEARELIDSTAEALQTWSEDTANLDILRLLQRNLHTLKGGARLADIPAIGDLSHELENLFEGLTEQRLSINDELSDLLFLCHDRLAGMVENLEAREPPRPAPDLIGEVQAYMDSVNGTRPVTNVASQDEESEPGAKVEEQAPLPDMEEPENSLADLSDLDQELVGIFLEEGLEIYDTLGEWLGQWRDEPEELTGLTQLQQELHTLKGGARLSGIAPIANLAEAWSDALDPLISGSSNQKTLLSLSDRALGSLKAMLNSLEDGNKPELDTGLIEDFQAAHEVAAKETAAPREDSEQSSLASVTPEPTKPEASTPAAKSSKPAARARKQAADAQRTAQETIRVSAPLLDELVNLAGETSITRGRLEQQTSDFGYTLDEMAATIERLREQLRRMEIETEAQILFSAEKEHGPDYGDDFDPLEMDRYSSIQQLSRALTESSSDLADLRETLSDRVRDTETLLVQQSRINTELQEGLMKTRMIPFASMVPRLRRIVRQISGELGKKVTFDVRNAEGEMDRNILERMIAPLEHMLRNALDHGIESPADRKKAGKPETGEVTLSLTREGGDVVLRMIDDGAGIPSSVIRDKAIRQGLLRENEELSEREILQFILQPGFSTARQVTQISGRGVGMDVVASEIKQLGGSLDIDSAVGRGTTFTVRLPFTVSVNRALMVSTGEDFYAIPLNTIEGIVRVSTYELEEYYKPDAPLYEYAGQEYRLQYLGSLLNSDHQPKLQGQALPLPVILVRGAEQPLALQVDNLIGSREIVVKSLGPQFSSVRGVSGATILGDGNVVVILDLPAMIRSDILSERQRLTDLENARESARHEEQAAVVMVVDDSVTVRKVTSRLLERNGMEVITAKDGLDAVAQLQDHKPDIILLDIEMPRMDGFEVASFVRHDDNLRETPICMITSRTGEKHRERALAIGVNEYLGKPFQEAELLETIKRLTGRR
jgi:chemosensory pili system protein ChpA (sensor histidine kinase/response regulator)